MTERRRAALSISILGTILYAVALAAEDTSPLRPGEVLDHRSWQRAEGLLPPEVIDHYKRGDYVNPIAEWPNGAQQWGQDFLDGTQANRDRFIVGERGTIIEKATGRQPAYVIGFPFPDIDPADPQAAIKILWNYYYQYWYNGNSHHVTIVNWIGRRGLEREAIQEVFFLYYDGQPREFIPAQNPNNVLSQFLATTLSPTDLYGTTALDWRYRDADKRDSVWAYVPALRRIRAVSPANRSDGFLGSDLSQDDGPFFDGKPEDFTWRFVGEQDMLRFADPYSLRHEVEFFARPTGGWRVKKREEPFAGYQVPGWKGAPWAPVGLVLVKRPHWIIEAIPNDTYYLAGKIVLAIDKETYDGSWNQKYSWRGELTHVFFNSRTLNQSPDGGKNYFSASPAAIIAAENVKLDRATIAGQAPERFKDSFFDFRVPLAPEFFNFQALARFGK